jgi:hypothetical protein
MRKPHFYIYQAARNQLQKQAFYAYAQAGTNRASF